MRLIEFIVTHAYKFKTLTRMRHGHICQRQAASEAYNNDGRKN